MVMLPAPAVSTDAVGTAPPVTVLEQLVVVAHAVAAVKL